MVTVPFLPQNRRCARVTAVGRHRAVVDDAVIGLADICLPPACGHAIGVRSRCGDCSVIDESVAAAVRGHAIIECAGSVDDSRRVVGQRVVTVHAEHGSATIAASTAAAGQRYRACVIDLAIAVDADCDRRCRTCDGEGAVGLDIDNDVRTSRGCLDVGRRRIRRRRIAGNRLARCWSRAAASGDCRTRSKKCTTDRQSCNTMPTQTLP